MGKKKISLLSLLLFPFAVLYGVAVRIRNKLFDFGILKSKRFPLPVICVGNITVGGTGKTPHTEYLIGLLQKNYRLAVLSRGYKRKSKGFVLASAETGAEIIGDEPYQMARKFPNVYVAVDRDRRNGIEQLTNGVTAPGTEVILLDDAFQHRYVKAGLSVLLIDYNRPIHTDCLLPAGRLREPESGKQRADIIIVTKCPANLSAAEKERLRKDVNPVAGQLVYFTCFDYGKLYPLSNEHPEKEIEIPGTDCEILLVTGIASPALIIKKLSACAKVHPLTFGDHHDFNAGDFLRIQKAFETLPEEHRLIVITEKDAARLANHPLLADGLKQAMYVLPVTVKFLDGEEKLFDQNIIEYVRKENCNG